MSGADLNDLTEWLEPRPVQSKFSAADIATLKAFGMKPPKES